MSNDKQLNKISEIGNIKIDKGEIKRVDQTKYLVPPWTNNIK